MRCVYTFLLVLLVCDVYAQQLKGRVLGEDAGGRTGLPGANVYWAGTTRGVVTDADGYFQIHKGKEELLIASFTGYRPDTLRITSVKQAVEFVLKEGQQLEEVKVVKRSNTTILSTRGAVIGQVITGGELTKAACCNLGESFETNASVDVSYADAVTGAKQIQLLGLTGKYIQMLTEGLPNFRGLAALYGLSYIPGPWMEAISISKGTSSVVGGYEAIAGQISVDYKKPQLSEKVYGNVYGNSMGMFEFNANTGIKINEKWSTAVLAHGDWYNQRHDGNHDGFLDMPVKTQYNLMNRWAYKDDSWFFQFGGKFLDETRQGGQVDFRKGMPRIAGEGNLYGIGIDARRYEAFLKIGYLMPQYPNSSMALLTNYTDHRQDSYYGVREYDGRQKNVYLNYIYQSVFGNNINQKYSAGASFNYDWFDEFFKDYVVEENRMPETGLGRIEKVGGVFFQYTGTFWQKLTVMAGLRFDYHNKFHGFWTPRVHVSYSPDDMTNLKISAGKGYRTANVLSENSYLLASARSIYVDGKLLAENPDALDRLDMEEAWNFGVHVNRKFILFERMLNLNLEYYRTNFLNQVIVDNETQAGRVNFFNLDGRSYSNCYQVEVKYELIPRLELTAAYRYNDVKYTLDGELVRMPLQSRYKGLLNLSYYTNMRKWQFDFTTQFNGSGRMPSEMAIPAEFRTGTTFKAYQLMNAQVTKYFKRWSVYAGCENIGDFVQKAPIVGAENPWSNYFDSSRIWGPLYGRKFYLGLRLAIDRI